MIERKKASFFFFALITLALMVSACGQVASTGSSNNSANNLTPMQVLQKSADAMKQLKSSHIDMQSTANTQVVGPSGTTTGKSTPTTTGSTLPTAGNVRITTTGSGDESTANNTSQFNLTVNSLQQPLKLAEVTQGNNVYIQNQQGKWYVLNKNDMSNSSLNPFNGMTIDQQSLLGALQDVKIVDRGTENLNGQSMRHITATLDKQALQKLMSSDPQLKNQLGQQNVDTFLNNAKTFTGVVDLWIDQQQFYVHKTQLKMDLAEDAKSMGQNAPSAMNLNFNTTVNLSKFNQPVNVTVPKNATPTNNPQTVFGVSTSQNGTTVPQQ